MGLSPPLFSSMQGSPFLRTCYSNGKTWTINENKKNYGGKKRKLNRKEKTLKRRNIKQQQAFVHSEGQQYKSNVVHENSSK